jgi:hypothetical protein
MNRYYDNNLKIETPLGPMQFLFLSRFRMLVCHTALVALALPAGLSQAAPVQLPPSRLYVNLSAKPDPRALLAFDLCIIDPATQPELGPGRALGHTYLARLATIAVTPGSELAKTALEQGLVMPDRSTAWDHLLLDILHPAWADTIIERHAKAAAQQGFTGFLVQGAESLRALDALRPAKADQHRQAFIDLIHRLHQRFPDKPIVLHRGLDLTPALQNQLHAVFLDGVFQTQPADAPTARPIPPEQATAIEVAIRNAQSRGLKIFAAEFGDPASPSANLAAADRLKRLGCVPFITTPDLSGLVLGPHLPASRHVLVIHGWDPDQAARAVRPVSQTWTAQTLGSALHWLGLKPEYVSVPEWTAALARPDQLLHPLPAAILIDPDTTLPAAAQTAFAAWLVQAKASHIPILLGTQPLTDSTAWTSLASALGLQGSGQPLPSTGRTRLSRFQADWLLPSQLPEQQALRPLDLQAPADATPILSYHATTSPARSDTCFITPWGGVWLARAALAPVDPFRFLESALQRQDAAPIPDLSTLAGRQIYLSTVQGRGFCDTSWLPNGPLCSEILRDELNQFPALPVTVSVAEADVRGWSDDSLPTDALRYEAVARALFAQPQVEPASNTFSRPANWHPDHFESGPLRAVIPDARSGIKREIVSSMAYLQRRLIPPNKSPLFLLWPEGSAPTAEAFDLLASFGGRHLPGSWLPGWHVSPFQPSPSSNEAAEFPAHSSAEALAQTWLAQHNPAPGHRRLGPIHLAYAFADLKEPANLDALRQIWTWCSAQPLHPMVASTYTRLAEDAAAIQIYPVKTHHWLVVSAGRPATLRLPASRGLPDLTRSTGVTGYSQHAGQLYLHLSGQHLSEIILRPAADILPHLHLVEADRLLDFHQLTSDSARFRLQSRDPARVTLGGLKPGSTYLITASGSQAQREVDQAGHLTLQAPPLATISIQPSPGKPYAAR